MTTNNAYEMATVAGGPARYASATVAGGCFWCTEAVYQRVKGVISVIPGYTGGTKLKPTYDEVCSGKTGHAEAAQITFDPSIIPYDKILEIFWHIHDPTTLNRQGNDVGTQYRSAIFYQNERQKQTAKQSKANAQSSKMYKGKIVTEILPLNTFYTAESYHRDYYSKNSYQPYCQYIIEPKIHKLYKDFPKETRETL